LIEILCHYYPQFLVVFFHKTFYQFHILNLLPVFDLNGDQPVTAKINDKIDLAFALFTVTQLYCSVKIPERAEHQIFSVIPQHLLIFQYLVAQFEYCITQGSLHEPALFNSSRQPFVRIDE
jgi:hypothetical protein